MASVTNTSFLNNSGYTNSHTLSGVAVSGDLSHLLVAGLQRNISTEVSGVTAAGNTMARYGASENSNVVGVEWYSYTINNSSVSIIGSTPAYKLFGLLAVALSGVNQTTPVTGTPVIAGGFGTTASASYTGTAGNLLLVTVGTRVTAAFTASNCTEAASYSHLDGNLGGSFVGYVTATGVAQTIGATIASADNWQVSIIEIKTDEGLSSDTISITEEVTVFLSEDTKFDTITISEAVTVVREGGSILNISVTTTDNFQSRVLVELGRFRTWAGSSHKLWLGEWGIANNKATAEQLQWNRILEILNDKLICDNIATTYWATGHAWGTYNLEPYTGATTSPGTTWSDNAISPSYDASLAKAEGYVPFVGINYAGHEFGISEQAPTAAPARSDLLFHRARGNKVMRYPLGEPIWTTEWFYIPATDEWRGTNIQHIENVMNRAAQENIQIILDILHPGGGSKYATIGGASIANATNYGYYIAYAKKLLNHSFVDHLGNTVLLKNHSALYGVDLVNEPQTLGSGAGNQWLGISQTIVNDFRNVSKVNYQGTIFVALPHYSGVQDITNNAPSGPWITDPINNFWYAGHYYPEVNHTGTFNDSYQMNIDGSGSFAGQGSFSCAATGTSTTNNFSDVITIIENTVQSVTIFLVVNDTISSVDLPSNTSLTADLSLVVSDQILLTEATTLEQFIVLLTASVADQITITESSTGSSGGILISANDIVSISEVITSSVSHTANVFDAISITENTVRFVVNLQTSVFDTIFINEILLSNPDQFAAFLADDIAVSEDMATELTLSASAFSTIFATEEILAAIVTTVEVNDAIGITDTVSGFQFKSSAQLSRNRARGGVSGIRMKRAGYG